MCNLSSFSNVFAVCIYMMPRIFQKMFWFVPDVVLLICDVVRVPWHHARLLYSGRGVIQPLTPEVIWDLAHLVDSCCLWYFFGHFSDPGFCITNVIATCRKHFSQWERSFLWKLRCHWLKFLRHVAKTLVIQGPGFGETRMPFGSSSVLCVHDINYQPIDLGYREQLHFALF